jgi:hypothetical protein
MKNIKKDKQRNTICNKEPNEILELENTRTKAETFWKKATAECNHRGGSVTFTSQEVTQVE